MAEIWPHYVAAAAALLGVACEGSVDGSAAESARDARAERDAGAALADASHSVSTRNDAGGSAPDAAEDGSSGTDGGSEQVDDAGQSATADAAMTPAPEGDFVYVAVSDQASVETSCDGQAWSTHTVSSVPADALLRGVGYGNGRFVAVGGEYRTRVIVYSDDGVHWNREDQSALCAAQPERCNGEGVCTQCDWVGDVAWIDDGDGGLWVAGGGNGHRLWSRQGVVWEPLGDTPFDGSQYRRLANAGSRAVAAGNDALAVITLAPGADPPLRWTATSVPSGELWRLTHGDGVALAVNGSLCLRNAPGGTAWSDCELPSDAVQLSFAGFLDGTFYIGGPEGSMTSDDGSTFVGTDASGHHNRDLVTGPDRLVGWRGYSLDGLHWTEASPAANDPRDVAGGRIAGTCP